MNKMLKTGSVYTLYPTQGECPLKSIRRRCRQLKQMNAEIIFSEEGFKNLLNYISYDYAVIKPITSRIGTVVLDDELEERLEGVKGTTELSFRWADAAGKERNFISVRKQWMLAGVIDKPMKEDSFNTDYYNPRKTVIVAAPLEK